MKTEKIFAGGGSCTAKTYILCKNQVTRSAYDKFEFVKIF